MAETTVLVVDDDRFFRQMVGEMLTEHGMTVLHAKDGAEGLTMAAAHRPDLMLLDVVMPGIDGLEACRRLRNDPLLAALPVILMTSRVELDHLLNPFQIGADDYVAKPFQPHELVGRICGTLAKKQAIASLEKKARTSQALLEITESVSSSESTVEILRCIVNRIATEIDDVYRCSIALIQEDEEVGYVLASSDDPSLSGLRIELERYPEIRQVVRTGKPILIEDVGRDPLLDEVRQHLDTDKFNAIMVLPVTAEGRVIGAMVVRLARSRPQLCPNEVEFCQLVANVVAPALRSAQHIRSSRQESDLLKRVNQSLEEELQAKHVYEMLFENASEGLAAFNARGEVLLVNRRALDIIGRRHGEVLRRPLTDFLDLRARRIVARARREHASSGSVVLFDLPFNGADGEQRILSTSLTAQPVTEDLWVVAVRDVTERRRVEDELQQTRYELEAANERLTRLDRSRADFLNAVAHDLRIPAAVIAGYCELLQEGGESLSAEQRDYLQATVDSCQRLGDLVDSLLDLARLEAGKLVMEMAPVDLAALCREVQRDFLPLARAQQLSLELAAPQSLAIDGDADYLHRVLSNLLSNALKFTPSGGRIALALHDAGTAVEVSVSDSGIGIPLDRQGELFSDFTQLGRGDAKRGSGLGLAICRRIVEAHCGRIWVESAPGAGSRFVFTLPHG